MNTAVQPTAGPQGRHGQTVESTQLVSFRLAEEEYGIEITKVQEIILLGEITRVPRTPDYIKGLINLRSEVIPVVDFRRRFGLPAQEPTDETRIMVVNVRGKTLGMIVDAVSEVLRVPQAQIVPPPPAVSRLGPRVSDRTGETGQPAVDPAGHRSGFWEDEEDDRGDGNAACAGNAS